MPLREDPARAVETMAGAVVALALVASIASGAGVGVSAAVGLGYAGVLLGLVALGLADRPGALRWVDGPRLVLLAAAAGGLAHVYRAVGGDGYEYYSLLRSPILDGDFDFANDFAGLGVPPVRSGRGEITVRVAMGVSVAWAPWFLATHAAVGLARLLGAALSVDGFTPVYHAAVTTATYAYGWAALALIESMLRPRVGRALALILTLALWLATPLHFYMTANASMSHGVSAFAATAMVWCWLRARGSTPDASGDRRWLWVGLFGGLAALVRPQDTMLLAIPALDLLLDRHRPRVPRVLQLALGPAVLGLSQLALWFAFYGTAFVSVVREMNWVAGTPPHVLDFLFAARHGLFTWTPLFLLGALGWLLLLRAERRMAALFLLAFALAVIVNSSTTDWWSSESFGQRRMLSFLPLFALGLAAAADALRRHPVVPIACVLAALALWNILFEQTYNAEVVAPRSQAVDLDRLTRAQIASAQRHLVRWHARLPARLWALAHDNLSGIWIDEGSRSLGGVLDLGREPEDLSAVVGHGWYAPEDDAGVTARRTRGWRSWLRVPVRTPGGADLVLRVRQAVPELPVRVRVELNGTALGEADLRPEWQDLTFAAPADLVRPGLNDLALVFSATPRGHLPGYHGKDSAAVVDSLHWTRRP